MSTQPPPYPPIPQEIPGFPEPLRAAKPKKPFYTRWWFIVIAVVIVIGAVGNALGAGTKGAGISGSAVPATSIDPQVQASASAAAAASASAEAAARASAQAAARASASAASQSAAAAEAQASASAAAEKAAAATQNYGGKGDSVIKLKDFKEQLVLATLTYTGSGNFAVWSIDGQGDHIDLLVNVIGKYSGIVPLNFSEDPAALKITASGSWTINTMPLNQAPRWDGAAPYSGKGDAVVIVQDVVQGLTTVTISNTGKSNFVVRAYSAKGADLLVNEIGNYTGTTLLPSGTILLEVNSAGSWSVTK
jgi:hypothetical protein